jgi:hypothetical protein
VGGSGNPGLEQAHQRLEQAKQSWKEQATAFKTAIQKLVGTQNIYMQEE